MLGSRFAEKLDVKVAKLRIPAPGTALNVPTQAQADFSVRSGGLESFRPGQFSPLFETSFSWIEMLISEVALLGLFIVFSVVAMTSPTSALTIAPTFISARRPYARTYSPPVNSRVQYERGVTRYLRLHRRRFQ